jgi:hypothetical protein
LHVPIGIPHLWIDGILLDFMMNGRQVAQGKFSGNAFGCMEVAHPPGYLWSASVLVFAALYSPLL